MFIKLTGANGGSPVVVRPELISVITLEVNETETHTNFAVENVAGYFMVQETPEQIMEMIENARN